MNTRITSYWSAHWWVVLVIFLHAGSFAACSNGIGEHIRTYRELRAYARAQGEERDMSTERISDNGLYRISFEPQGDAIPLSRLHTWKIRVHAADGGAIEEAVIQVDGGMPEHGHGLPTRPQVTRAFGGGEYLVEGMKFQMPGWWIVRFDVAAGPGTDAVTFNLML